MKKIIVVICLFVYQICSASDNRKSLSKEMILSMDEQLYFFAQEQRLKRNRSRYEQIPARNRFCCTVCSCCTLISIGQIFISENTVSCANCFGFATVLASAYVFSVCENDCINKKKQLKNDQQTLDYMK